MPGQGTYAAAGINNTGNIVGYYVDGSSKFHGFLETANPPPPAGTTADMILRQGAFGTYEIYDIGNNAMLAAYQLGQVGTEWQFVGLGGFFGSDTTDMLLRNSNTGGFEVLRHRQQSNHGSCPVGLRGLGLAARRLRGGSPDRLHGQLGLDLTTRASDGRFWRRRRSRELEYRTAFCRHIPASVSDGPAAARMCLRSAQE